MQAGDLLLLCEHARQGPGLVVLAAAASFPRLSVRPTAQRGLVPPTPHPPPLSVRSERRALRGGGWAAWARAADRRQLVSRDGSGRARAPVTLSAVLAELRGGSDSPGGAGQPLPTGWVPRICQLGPRRGGGGPGDTAVPIVTQQVGLELALNWGPLVPRPGGGVCRPRVGCTRGPRRPGHVLLPPRPLFTLLDNGRDAAPVESAVPGHQQVRALPSQLSPPGPSPPPALCAQGLLVLEARWSLGLDSWQPRLGPPRPRLLLSPHPGLSPSCVLWARPGGAPGRGVSRCPSLFPITEEEGGQFLTPLSQGFVKDLSVPGVRLTEILRSERRFSQVAARFLGLGLASAGVPCPCVLLGRPDP